MLPDTWATLNETCHNYSGQLWWFDTADDLQELRSATNMFNSLSNEKYFTGKFKIIELVNFNGVVRAFR